MAYLRDWGARPGKVIDVGAYHGEWTKMFRQIFPDAEALMVEAQERLRPVLENCVREQGGAVKFEIALLGAKDGEKVSFVELGGGTGSSVFEEASPIHHRTKVEKQLRTLDPIALDHGFADADFLKIDVQGYELEVLKGASSILSSVEFVLVESSLIPINKGCPLIHEVMAFMAARGFRLLDFCSQIRRHDKALWQTDLLFIKSDSDLLPAPYLDLAN